MKRWLALLLVVSLCACECKDVDCDEYSIVRFNFILVDDQSNQVSAPWVEVYGKNGGSFEAGQSAETGGIFYTVNVSPPDEEYFLVANGKHVTINLEFTTYRTECCGYPYKVKGLSASSGSVKLDEKFKTLDVYRIQLF